MSTNVIIVVIAGASGSGKSSLARNVLRDLADKWKVSILHEDAYYRQQTNLELNQRALTNYDHPDAIEEALLVKHLKQLKSGQSVQVPVYDYRIHDRTGKTVKLDAPDVLIVEGILLLHRQAVRDLASISVFVDVAEETCLERRIERDVRERGRSRRSVREQYEQTVGPMFRQFVKPSSRHADMVVSHGGQHKDSIAKVVQHVRCVIENSLDRRSKN